MKKLVLLGMVAYAVFANAAHADTLELKVSGLNCALCSEQMKEAIVKATAATAIEPKLECGVIYIDTKKPPAEVEGALIWPLTSHGFNLVGVVPSQKTMAEAKGMKC